jgi:RNA polymerase sigma factor (sigma-70 family)
VGKYSPDKSGCCTLSAESITMRQIKNQNLAQLLVQLRFTPAQKRRKQLDSTEKLLAIIEADKEYPIEFVCYRITGFRPKAVAGQQLIKGDELADDLQIFVSKLSSQLARPVSEQDQKVYTIEELAETLGVSAKTIHRWRKRGLIALKFTFDDGKKRFGFLQSTVDAFLRKNPALVTKAGNFTRLTKKQKQQIIKQACELSLKTTMSRYQVIEHIAAKTGRAHETIRYVLLNYQKANPEKSVLNRPPGATSPAEAIEIYKLFMQGCDVKELMRRFNRSKSSIYRIINLRRAKALLAKKIEFIASNEFVEEKAEEKILAEPIVTERPASRKSIEPLELYNESLLPGYLQALRDTPVLNRQREIELFRRYNYLKYLACITRAGINPTRASGARLTKIENYLAEAETIKQMIIEANLRLVVSIAGKHAAGGADFPELVSKGNFALIKAVEEFDYTSDIRFSRRASLNIAKEYAKVSGKSTELTRKKASSLANAQRYLRTGEIADFAAIERSHQSLVQVIRDNLDQREQYIILNHFGLIGSPIKKEKKTLNQIGRDLDMSKERVRQIELIALQKLKHLLSIEEFELLTG